MTESFTADRDAPTLRLLWPQWQGATAANVAELTPELPYDRARRGYALGTRILDAVLPVGDAITARVPTELEKDNPTVTDGIESRDAVLTQLSAALGVIERHAPARILTLGGDCSVSVAPFAWLAARHPGDLAVVWIDAHPDVGTPASQYDGYHAMAVSALVGQGDADVLDCLPARLDPAHVALAGLHAWTDDDRPNIEAWGLSRFSPDDLRDSSAGLLAWLAASGCTRVAIHLDVDVVDPGEVILGLGAEPGGLSIAQVRRVIADLARAADVVALTVAEYVPRQTILLTALLDGLPLIGDTRP